MEVPFRELNVPLDLSLTDLYKTKPFLRWRRGCNITFVQGEDVPAVWRTVTPGIVRRAGRSFAHETGTISNDGAPVVVGPWSDGTR